MKAEQQDPRLVLTIRIGRDSLTFSVSAPDTPAKMAVEPYQLNNSISTAANLREAFDRSELLQSGYKRAVVMLDTPTMLVPFDEYDEAEEETLYSHTFTHTGKQLVMAHSVLPELNVVAVFAVNRDLRLVLEDHFEVIRLIPVGQPVWLHLFERHFTSTRTKLYAHFHDGQMEVFSFCQNRFKFYNSYDARHAHDALYFLLYAWKQLGFHAENDELHLVGSMDEERNGERGMDWLCEHLRQYLQRVSIINPAGDFNHAPLAKVKDVPYDLMALYL